MGLCSREALDPGAGTVQKVLKYEIFKTEKLPILKFEDLVIYAKILADILFFCLLLRNA